MARQLVKANLLPAGVLDRCALAPRQALHVQATPRAEEVAPGGIGSTLAFTEDSRLGPEPMLWSSPGAGRPGAVARNSRVCAWRGRCSGKHDKFSWAQTAGVLLRVGGNPGVERPGIVARRSRVCFWSRT